MFSLLLAWTNCWISDLPRIWDTMWCHCNGWSKTVGMNSQGLVNTLRPRQNGRHFPDDIVKRIFLNENIRISIKIWLKFALKGPINNIPSLVQLMAWHRPGNKTLFEPTMVRLLTYICVTQPQWVQCDQVKCYSYTEWCHMGNFLKYLDTWSYT